VYADINGLKLFYEIRGESDPGKVPVVLLHGAISATGTSFGSLPDLLAQTRQVIAVEQQGHGRTADIDRPLSVQAMADDTLALLASLGIGRADLLGYSLGAGIALNIITSQPAVVRKAVLASVAYDKTGLHPGMYSPPDPRESADTRSRNLQIPFEREYRALAPDPGAWPTLLAKVQAMELPEITPRAISAIEVPILLIIGDSDIVAPEHAVAMFRLLGGGVPGDLAPMPATQLAVLPGTSHIGVTSRADMLKTMIPPFLDAPDGRTPRTSSRRGQDSDRDGGISRAGAVVGTEGQDHGVTSGC
jgi:pimeloyl-ACP methyl ester carboxylesterase